jgi:hypothetical protein
MITDQNHQFESTSPVERSTAALVEFLEALKSVQARFHWVLESDRSWQAERRSQARQRVRAYPKDGPGKRVGLDPVGALCYALTDQLYAPGFWRDAAQAVGLPLILASHVIAAADDRTWNDFDGQRRPDKYLLFLRDELIDLLRLRR